jgi:hypothetical protein
MATPVLEIMDSPLKFLMHVTGEITQNYDVLLVGNIYEMP